MSIVPSRSMLKNETMNITMVLDHAVPVLTTDLQVRTMALGAKKYVLITESTFTSYSDYFMEHRRLDIDLATDSDFAEIVSERVTVTLDKIVEANHRPSTVPHSRQWDITATSPRHTTLSLESAINRYDYWLGIVGDE